MEGCFWKRDEEEVNFSGDTPISAFVLLGWTGIPLKKAFFCEGFVCLRWVSLSECSGHTAEWPMSCTCCSLLYGESGWPAGSSPAPSDVSEVGLSAPSRLRSSTDSSKPSRRRRAGAESSLINDPCAA